MCVIQKAQLSQRGRVLRVVEGFAKLGLPYVFVNGAKLLIIVRERLTLTGPSIWSCTTLGNSRSTHISYSSRNCQIQNYIVEWGANSY